VEREYRWKDKPIPVMKRISLFGGGNLLTAIKKRKRRKKER